MPRRCAVWRRRQARRWRGSSKCRRRSPPSCLLAPAAFPASRPWQSWAAAVRRDLPAAELHVFGIPSAPPANGGAVATAPVPPPGVLDARSFAGSTRDAERGITWHAAPADSAAAFACGSIHAVPLRFGSGVRMKVLEAWARGVPVVATPEGAAGLEAVDGVELLVARDAAEFAAAFRRLREEPGLAAALAAGGRAALRRRHDPVTVARRLLALYAEVLAGKARP
jgi:glycosyltransferase involved in cell wall biosynthesis